MKKIEIKWARNTKKIYVGQHCVMEYKHCPKKINFISPMINDENQNLCDGWFIPNDNKNEDEQILSRVWFTLKPMGEIVFDASNTTKTKRFIRMLVENPNFDYRKYTNGGKTFLRVCVKGRLGDIFPLAALAQDYAGVIPEGEILAHSNDTIQQYIKAALDEIPLWLRGLLLGYPVENTISLYHML